MIEGDYGAQKPKGKNVWELVELLNISSRKIRSYNNTARFYGTDEKLFLSEAHTIHHIGEHQGISMNDLADVTQRTKGSTSTMVDSLIKRGLVTKRKDAEDQRRVQLQLTEKGQLIYQYHEQLDRENYSSISDQSSNLSDEDLNVANKVVKQVIRKLFDN